MGTRRRNGVAAAAQSPACTAIAAMLFVSATGTLGAPAQAKERSGEQIVAAQCATCHEAGKSGAPKIGDRAAWIARARQGLDPLVASAMKGHGSMPARGGLAELSDAELRNAVVYMLNSGSGAVTGQDYRVVADTTLDFGVLSASAMRSRAKDYPPSVYGTVPSLPDHYYVTVAAFDARTGRRITDAVVRARVSGAAGTGREQTLKPITVGGTVSYGGYFPMAGGGPYKVAVHVMRPGSSAPVDAQFQYSP
jgi:cytochrome c5